MKSNNKFQLNMNKMILISMIESILGVLGILFWIVLVVAGEIQFLSKWLLTVVLSMHFVWSGVRGIKLYFKIKHLQ